MKTPHGPVSLLMSLQWFLSRANAKLIDRQQMPLASGNTDNDQVRKWVMQGSNHVLGTLSQSEKLACLSTLPSPCT